MAQLIIGIFSEAILALSSLFLRSRHIFFTLASLFLVGRVRETQVSTHNKVVFVSVLERHRDKYNKNEGFEVR